MKTSINKLIAIGSLAAFLALSTHASADGKKHLKPGHVKPRHQTTERARVVDVDPVYRRIAYEEPVRVCRGHSGHRPNHGHRQGSDHHAVIGGIVGGVIGNRIGNKIRHRTGDRHAQAGGTIAGAIIGSVIADNAHSRHNQHHGHRPGRRCTVHMETHYRRELSYYVVTYRWHGQYHEMRTHTHPGRYVEVEVTVRPHHNRPGHNRPHHNRPHHNRPGHNRPSRPSNHHSGHHGGHHNNHHRRDQRGSHKRVVRTSSGKRIIRDR